MFFYTETSDDDNNLVPVNRTLMEIWEFGLHLLILLCHFNNLVPQTINYFKFIPQLP